MSSAPTSALATNENSEGSLGKSIRVGVNASTWLKGTLRVIKWRTGWRDRVQAKQRQEKGRERTEEEWKREKIFSRVHVRLTLARSAVR